MWKKILLILVAALSAGVAGGQHMFDYSNMRQGMFRAKTVSEIRSMNDGEHYTVVEEGRIVRYNYKNGNSTGVIFDASGFSEIERIGDYIFSGDETKILLPVNIKPIYRHSYIADHYIYNIRTGELSALTTEGGEQVPAFSPDSRQVAFVRENDIWLCNLSDGEVVRVTDTGRRNRIINGHTDWVYEEEYSFTRAFEFSPDGASIAYLSFDETEVPEFTMMMYTGRLYPEPYTYKYPKAGEKNSKVNLYLYSLDDGMTRKIDTGDDTDRYIPRIGWTPDGTLFYYHVNRLQNHFELLLVDRDGSPHKVYDEKDDRYIERPNEQTVTFLKKDRFIVRNETSGYSHLYMFDPQKGLTDTLTQGRWDVTDIVSVTDDRVYYISTEGSPLRRHLYSVKHNGKGKTRLTEEEGYWTVSPSNGFRYYIGFYSNAAVPPLIRLHDRNGKVIRTLEDNAALWGRLAEKRVPRKEFFQFRNDYGNILNGYMIKPGDFDPSRKYPVLFTQYSGPGSQQVLDRWSMDWTDVLVQEGYIVMCVDGRGTGGRGADFRKCTYLSLGKLETEDQISAAKYAATLPYVDQARIGIYGWSFGGFMALNCILHGNDIYKTAIAVAPVTSWRFYDTIYTEIYNGLPQDNASGYDDFVPLNNASRLKGNLLIIHGTADDNVHVHNTYAFISKLQKEGKKFDLMIYPDDNHSMRPTGSDHIRETMIGYVLENL